jgi:hypothetical protein
MALEGLPHRCDRRDRIERREDGFAGDDRNLAHAPILPVTDEYLRRDRSNR